MAVKPRTVHLADVSHHQARLSLKLAKEKGLKGFYHKVSEGDTVVDEKYPTRRKQAGEVKIPIGGYHFARAEYLKRGPDAVREARRFIDLCKPREGDLIPALDLETAEGLTAGQLKTWARLFAEEVERLIGVPPVIYSPWELSLGLIRWVPRYNNQNEPPRIPWDIWQFSNGEYGVPDSFPGLGHVDLNTFRKGFTLKQLRYKKPAEPKAPPEFKKYRIGHFSMQFSDTPDQKKKDAEKIFSLDLDAYTGTEAGPGRPETRRILKAASGRHKYHFYVQKNTWVAIKESRVKKDTLKPDYVPVLTQDEGVGHHDSRGIAFISYWDLKLQRQVTVGAGHYLTHGRKPRDPNYSLNVRYARAIGDWALEHGKGRAIVFYGGDQNMPDTTGDTFLGEPLTSFQDELGRHFGTGHGPIDVIASADFDGAVTAVDIDVLNDKKFFLHTDHYGLVGVAEIKTPRKAAA